jgi:regulator of chromosome condensation
MKIKVNGELEYDTNSVLQHHITPGRMYIAGTPLKSGGTAAGGANRDHELVALKDVKTFGCGAYHSMVVVVGDLAYACGLNNYGQLGLGGQETTSKDYMTPVPALHHQGIVSMKGGMHHSLVLRSNGRMLAFGRADSGQIGSSKASTKTGEFASTPVTDACHISFRYYFSRHSINVEFWRVAQQVEPELPADAFVVGIGCGGNHNLALTDKNEVYSWGYGDMLALGHGEEKDEVLPKKLNFSKAKIKNITITQVL